MWPDRNPIPDVRTMLPPLAARLGQSEVEAVDLASAPTAGTIGAITVAGQRRTRTGFANVPRRAPLPRTSLPEKSLPRGDGKAIRYLAGAARCLPSRVKSRSVPTLFSNLVALVEQRLAFSARHGGAIVSGDTLHLSPMCRLLVARITQDHAVLVKGVQVTFLPSVPGHWPHLEKRTLSQQ